MMATRVALLMFVGCGRIGFDPAPGEPPDEPIALVQIATEQCANCSTVTASLDVTSENLLIALLYTCAPPDPGCPTPSISDAAGQAWGTPIRAGSTLDEGAAYLWRICSALGGPDAITVVNGSATYGLSLHVHEVSGVSSTECLDTVGLQSGTGAAMSVATASPLAQENEYIVAFFANNGLAGATDLVEGAGYTRGAYTITSGDDAALSEIALSGGTGGPTTATATQTMPGAPWQAVIAAFR